MRRARAGGNARSARPATSERWQAGIAVENAHSPLAVAKWTQVSHHRPGHHQPRARAALEKRAHARRSGGGHWSALLTCRMFACCVTCHVECSGSEWDPTELAIDLRRRRRRRRLKHFHGESDRRAQVEDRMRPSASSASDPRRQRHSSAPVPTDPHGLHALHGHVRSGGARQTRVCLCACCERTRARTPRQLWRKHAAMACKHGSTPCARAAYPRGTNTASPPRCTNSSGRVAPLHEALAARGASFAAQECALTGGRACMCAAPAKREEPIGVLTLARCSRV